MSEITDGECKDRQSACRKELYSAMFPRWAALLVIAAFVAIAGTLFALSLAARSEAGEAKGVAAVQAKEVEFLRRDIGELKDQNREILAIVRTLEREKK